MGPSARPAPSEVDRVFGNTRLRPAAPTPMQGKKKSLCSRVEAHDCRRLGQGTAHCRVHLGEQACTLRGPHKGCVAGQAHPRASRPRWKLRPQTLRPELGPAPGSPEEAAQRLGVCKETGPGGRARALGTHTPLGGQAPNPWAALGFQRSGGAQGSRWTPWREHLPRVPEAFPDHEPHLRLRHSRRPRSPAGVCTPTATPCAGPASSPTPWAHTPPRTGSPGRAGRKRGSRTSAHV